MPRKKYPKHALARMTTDEHAELRRRARAARLSLSRYLVESGLTTTNLPPAEGREERERALFHHRRAADQLSRLTHLLERGGAIPTRMLEAALRAQAQAAMVLASAYGRGSL